MLARVHLRTGPALLVAALELAVVGAAQTAPQTPAPAAAPSEDVLRFCGVFRLPSGGSLEVRPDASGQGLLVLGLGSKGALWLAGGKAPAERVQEAIDVAAERAERALRPLLSGKGEVDEAGFAGAAALAAAQKLVVGLEPRLGPQRTVRHCGSELPAQRVTWLVVRGRKASAWLKVQWSAAGKIAGLVEAKAAEQPPGLLALGLLRRDLAAGARGAQRTTLSVEGRGAGRVLVLEDRRGLFECPWESDLR